MVKEIWDATQKLAFPLEQKVGEASKNCSREITPDRTAIIPIDF